ncbi:methionine ABC transporter substrate-binding protein [Carnobacteriaceae bacterium zg-84]|uniref:MetQ/NlpA family ABC transporter substrate-binding protein n=1 Tax=Granulicatella sp. zg-84 TaxID=2678503 RepID=UPI0013BFE3CD|nr:MetQ/NlpA family ABC transporter substrate-binding protein [Granulicatella sp. zg-84]NEW65860.1 methionine ABC transporter substrate-binding protein [Granulicatella sp. zg-84]QMI86397.1 methionine ABC transporter substrate-binding protein [Carnobacteriaceae bacterium zg-84]
MIKQIKKSFTVALAACLLGACGQAPQIQSNQESTTKEPTKVKIAVVGSPSHDIWNFVAEKAKKENIDLEVIEMNDYVQPNVALSEGSIDLNAYQHRAYLKQWNTEHKDDLKEIGLTIITPLYFFSNKVKSLSDLPEGAKVAIPKEVAIQGRALVALQTAGVIKLKDGGSTKSSLTDIESNPKNIEFLEVESAQAVRTLDDVHAATIGGSFATDAGLSIKDNIFTDADYLDTIPADRYNIIAAKEKNADNPVYKKIVELFQSDDVVEKMNEVAPGQYYPVWKTNK